MGMNSDELVIAARLANHYEKDSHGRGQDPLDVAAHDVQKIKRDAPKLWLALWNNSNLDDRQIGDRLYAFLVRWKKSGMSLKNFAADEMESRKPDLLDGLALFRRHR